MRVSAFAGVGALGFVVQLAVVAALIGLARWPAPAATALGVEAAVLHNFAWHRRWTWRDRGRSPIASQLVRLHFANGLTSLAGNVGLSIALTGAGLNALLANAIAVGAMSVVNYALADGWVFKGVPALEQTEEAEETDSQEKRRNGDRLARAARTPSTSVAPFLL
jgi:putative flippase GtrA